MCPQNFNIEQAPMEPQARDTWGRDNSEACSTALQASPAFQITLVPYVVQRLHGLPAVCSHLRRSTGGCWGQSKEEEGGKVEADKRKISSVCLKDPAPLPRKKTQTQALNKEIHGFRWVHKVELQL